MKYAWLGTSFGLMASSVTSVFIFGDTEMALWYGVTANFFLALSGKYD